ncbi:MAG: DUF1573 domain-containing protein [Armatimonadetes bacterium]|nr:DUF1573 domain-containing protein [Armatimonadota bacterium]
MRRRVVGVSVVVATILAFALIPLRARAQNRIPPPLVSVSPTDMGTVFTPDSLPFPVTIQNTGNRALQVLRAATSCGCTTLAGNNRFLVTPFGQHTVVLVYDSSGRRGQQQLVLKLFVAGYKLPTDIPLTVNVVSQYPDEINIAAMRADRIVETHATILHRPGHPVAIHRAVYDGNMLRVAFEPTTDGDVLLRLWPVVKKTRERFFTRLVLWTNDPMESRKEIRVSGQVLPEILATPGSISLNILRPSEGVRKQLRVWSPYERKFHIRAIKTGTETVVAHYDRNRFATSHPITVRVECAQRKERSLDIPIQIFTDIPTNQNLTVRLYGMVKP